MEYIQGLRADRQPHWPQQGWMWLCSNFGDSNPDRDSPGNRLSPILSGDGSEGEAVFATVPELYAGLLARCWQRYVTRRADGKGFGGIKLRVSGAIDASLNGTWVLARGFAGVCLFPWLKPVPRHRRFTGEPACGGRSGFDSDCSFVAVRLYQLRKGRGLTCRLNQLHEGGGFGSACSLPEERCFPRGRRGQARSPCIL